MNALKQLRTIVFTILKEWKSTKIGWTIILRFLGNATKGAALGWIVYQSGNLESLGYLGVGVAFIAIWSAAIGFGGWALEIELYGGTLDFVLISHTSMSLVLFSKMLAQIIYEIPAGIVASVTVFIVANSLPQIENPATLFFSLILALLGLTVFSFFFGALVVLVGGKAGFFMGIIPFGAVLSGFILPVDQLPLGLEVLARFVPSSWAMDSVWISINGHFSWGDVIQGWSICILTSAIWFAITYTMCKVAEKRIRILGTLGTH